jgi:hypothetical protein
MKLSRSAIANYEGTRIPTIHVLIEFGRVAHAANRGDLANIFAKSIGKQIGFEDSF